MHKRRVSILCGHVAPSAPHGPQQLARASTAGSDDADFTWLPDVASHILGTKVLFATDEWFAAADNLLADEEAVFIPGKFTEFGKWMDGWESRRKRSAGHDWCVIELGQPGVIRGVCVDTSHFTGNFPPEVSLQACHAGAAGAASVGAFERLAATRGSGGGVMGTAATADATAAAHALASEGWTTLVSQRPLRPGVPETARNYFKIDAAQAGKEWTHLRLNIFPDGGVARLRVYGQVKPRVDRLTKGPAGAPGAGLVDLAAFAHGGLALTWSDAHYGRASNLIAPGRARNMGEGWETARKPDRPAVLRADPATGHLLLSPTMCDWAVLQLGVPGMVQRILVDTNHFKGNFPESCVIEATYAPQLLDDVDAAARVFAGDPDGPGGAGSAVQWHPLLPRSKLRAHEEIVFDVDGAASARPVSHVRLTIFPDGGVSRLRLWGTPQA